MGSDSLYAFAQVAGNLLAWALVFCAVMWAFRLLAPDKDLFR
jgi:hypothetical protein